MKKVIVCLGVFGFASLITSSLSAANLLGNGPTPPQSFHEAGMPSQPQQPTATPSSSPTPSQTKADKNATPAADNSQMSNVLAIMAAAKKQQTGKGDSASSTPAGDTAPVSAPTSVPTQPVNAPVTIPQPQNSAQDLQALEAEISQLNQNILLFQQQNNERVEELMDKNNALGDQVQKLDQALVLLNQEVNQQASALAALKSQPGSGAGAVAGAVAASVPVSAQHHLVNEVLIAALLLLLLSVVMVYVLLSRYKNKLINKKLLEKSSANSEDDTCSEYDYLSSEEAIPVQLDLARAYIAMQDHSTARKVLEGVLKKGDEAQKQQAQLLMEKIPATAE